MSARFLKTVVLFAFFVAGLEAYGQNWTGSTLGESIYRNGNVGIGIPNPNRRLTIKGDDANFGLVSNDGSYQWDLIMNPAWAPNSFHVWQRNPDAPRLSIASNGNVGIGTNSPTYKLDVIGNIYIPNGNALYSKNSAGNPMPLIQLTGSNNLRFLTGYNSNIEIYNTAQNVQLMTIQNGGNIGIGTTNPIQKLDIAGAVNPALVIRADVDPSNGVKIGATFGNLGAFIDVNRSNGPFYIKQGGIEKFAINANGNIGIGTVSPNYKLDVQGPVRNNNQLFIQNDVFSKSEQIITSAVSSGKWYRVMTIPTTTVSTYRTICYRVQIKYFSAASPNQYYDATATISLRIHDTGRYVYWSWEGRGYQQNIKLQRYPNDKNIELYAYSPGMWGFFESLVTWSGEGADDSIVTPILDITGFEVANSDQGVPVDKYGSFTFDQGYVGIGTNIPNNRLEVKSNVSNTYPVKFTTSDGTGGFYFHEAANGNSNMFINDNADATKVSFRTDGNPSFIINGNVGIGTTSPSEKLSVNGKIKTKEIIVTETGWSDYVFEDNYSLMPLEKVEEHIQQKKHLPDIPLAREVEANGVSLGEMQAKLLKKIEELTLYAIEQQKKIQLLENRLAKLEKSE